MRKTSLLRMTGLLLFFSFSNTNTHTLYFMETRDKGSLNKSFLSTLSTIFSHDIFIETGTFGGVTTQEAAHFYKSVYTVELFEPFFQRNKTVFAEHSNIHAYLGNSVDFFNQILPSLQPTPCLFFLDAHYSGPGTAKGKENTPIIEELAVIQKFSPNSVILIDDLRCFQTAEKITAQLQINPQETALVGYPSIIQLKKASLDINQNNEFIIYGDIALIYPKNIYPNLVISPTLKAMTVSRLFDEIPFPSDRNLHEVLDAEQIIMNTSGVEKDALKLLLNKEEGRQHPILYTNHYKLWNALILMYENQYQTALDLLNEVYSHGLNHFRIKNYIDILKRKLS